jgi:hypothetical protein
MDARGVGLGNCRHFVGGSRFEVSRHLCAVRWWGSRDVARFVEQVTGILELFWIADDFASFKIDSRQQCGGRNLPNSTGDADRIQESGNRFNGFHHRMLCAARPAKWYHAPVPLVVLCHEVLCPIPSNHCLHFSCHGRTVKFPAQPDSVWKWSLQCPHVGPQDNTRNDELRWVHLSSPIYAPDTGLSHFRASGRRQRYCPGFANPASGLRPTSSSRKRGRASEDGRKSADIARSSAKARNDEICLNFPNYLG